MNYYMLEPEVADGLGQNTRLDTSIHPPRVNQLHYEFIGWLGDELLESFPCFIVTAQLGEDFLNASLTGFNLDQVEVSPTPEFSELYRQKKLPEFRWLQINGQAGIDDFGNTPDGRLIVSESTKAILDRHLLSNCRIEIWQP